MYIYIYIYSVNYVAPIVIVCCFEKPILKIEPNRTAGSLFVENPSAACGPADVHKKRKQKNYWKTTIHCGSDVRDRPRSRYQQTFFIIFRLL